MSQRDGSLIRKKQEQWAREREEEKRESWFPFGRPGCGSPNRKFTSKSHEDPSSSSQGTSSSSSNPQMYEDDRKYEKKASSRHRSRSRSEERHRSHGGGDRNHSDDYRGHSRDHSRGYGSHATGHSSVYVNPHFAATLPPSASYILQENSRYEQENATLRQQLFQDESRIAALESQLAGAGGLRQELADSREEVARQRIVNQTLESNLRSATMRNNTLDRNFGQFRTQIGVVQQELATAREALRTSEATVQLKNDSMAVLLQRNEVLVKKGEELAEKVRIAATEKEESSHKLKKALQEGEDYRRSLETKARELAKAEEELTAAREKDRMWTVEKVAYERVIREKEAALTRLKAAQKPNGGGGGSGGEGYATVMRLLTAMREEYGGKIAELTARLDVAEELDGGGGSEVADDSST